MMWSTPEYLGLSSSSVSSKLPSATFNITGGPDQDHDDLKAARCCEFGFLNVNLSTEKCYKFIIEDVASLAPVIAPIEPSSTPSPNPALAARSSLGAHTYAPLTAKSSPGSPTLAFTSSPPGPSCIDLFERVDASWSTMETNTKFSSIHGGPDSDTYRRPTCYPVGEYERYLLARSPSWTLGTTLSRLITSPKCPAASETL
ncbi:uncharacterized protein EV420DRAFT_1652437 [Desarmillaria tabescens]|uniref:Uncharacterized protein n=1 Tax=Armillaria tabescens TaxID=1929756 RepID=A0AA39MK52_ARMTA|nr:uncharacterized protein EV420DRAFT_1652437 [Desarmillaria tabescens]KAK0436669.1 hypothetical protein EV420DRAFT_1652437 [Desarmillaria tabescens]